MLELDRKFGAQPFIGEQFDASIEIVQALNAPAAKQIDDSQVPVTQYRNLVLQALQSTIDVFIRINIERLLEMMGQAKIIDHDAELFAVPSAVHACDGLQ